MKLYYFDIYGRAEPTRFLLAHAKVDYEDVRITGEKFAELKTTGELEFGQVPALTHDGKHLCQTWSILRYLGKLHGYYPEDPVQAWKVDSTLDAVEDYLQQYFKMIFEKDEEKKEVLKAAWLKFAGQWLHVIEKRLEQNESQHYVVGSKMTIADFALACVAFNLILNEANPNFEDTKPHMEKFPILVAYAAHLKEDLKEHLEKRAVRPY